MSRDLGVGPIIFAIMVCFAANSVITRYLVIVSRVSPILVTVLRFGSGLAALLVLVSLRRPSFQPYKPNASNLPGAFFLGVYAFSISYGYLFISIAAGTLVFYTFVVLTMVSYSVVKDNERLTARLVLGLGLGLLGVLLITLGKISSVTLLGVLLMAATGASWGLYSAYGRKFDVAFSYTFSSFLIFGAAAIIGLTALLASGQPLFTNLSIDDLALALYMGMVSTALSYALWNASMKKITASLGGLVQVIVPVLAAVMGIIFLGEQVTVPLAFGGGLILIGIYLAGSKQTRNLQH